MARTAKALSLTVIACSTQTAPGQQMPPSYDFDFATIWAVGNPAYPGGPPPFHQMAGRGSVGYQYRISKMEVTTSQWMEFVNEYTVLGGSWTFFGEPVFWGAVPDPSYSGPGRRYVLDSSIPSAERLPVGGITWRDAARFCNWLCNDKAPTITAISNGAYDTSTFGSGPNNTFTDQLRHNPGAAFWIPTLDEWAKASNYDPNRYGPGQGGWWEYSYRSDAAPIPGVPGTGQTSAGVALEHFGEWEIPLGAYSSQRSPWGLFDTSGGSSEWTEEVNSESNPVWRMLKGTAAGEFNLPDMERVWGFGSGFPQSVNQFGLRIASSVPAPGTTLFGLGLGLLITRRKRDD